MTLATKLQPHELELLSILIKASPISNVILDSITNTKIVSLDFTGVGYFLTLSHPNFPTTRHTFSEPYVSGSFENNECGFLVFLENNELTIECHTSQGELSKNFRTSPVAISVS